MPLNSQPSPPTAQAVKQASDFIEVLLLATQPEVKQVVSDMQAAATSAQAALQMAIEVRAENAKERRALDALAQDLAGRQEAVEAREAAAAETARKAADSSAAAKRAEAEAGRYASEIRGSADAALAEAQDLRDAAKNVLAEAEATKAAAEDALREAQASKLEWDARKSRMAAVLGD